MGISEFFVKKGARLSFTMIHNWAEEMAVRPRSVAQVEEDGLFINNYICMKPVRSIQMYPTTYLVGDRATAMFYSVIVGSPGSNFDIGGRIDLLKPGCRAEIIQRAISNGGNIMNRGHLIGKAPDIKAHLECKGLLLKGGVIDSIPQLEGHVEGVDMSARGGGGQGGAGGDLLPHVEGLERGRGDIDHRPGLSQRRYQGPAPAAQGRDRPGGDGKQQGRDVETALRVPRGSGQPYG